MTKIPLILIGGPTASGKSALALEIARRENGIIINADAMQVYKGLPILTALPPPEFRRAVPHELYEVFDLSVRSSVGGWGGLARGALRRAAQSGRTAILVGGTGLYFKSLLEGLAAIPALPDDARAAARKLYDQLGHEAFRFALAALDPESAAKIKLNDRQRLIRAYEIVKYTGKTLSEWQKSKTSAPLDNRFAIRRYLLSPPRGELYDACNKRFARMIENGAIDEVRRLIDRKLNPSLPAMKIIGAREIAAFLRGEISREEAIAKAQQATRNYAKRQVTWFRNQWADGDLERYDFFGGRFLQRRSDQ